jgi:hypothetical protein
MNYPNYDAKVIERYQTKLIGWTYHEFKSPFDIHTIDDVRILLEALQCGRCCWVRMTKNDISRHREDIIKRKAAGEMVGKKRQPRSDKGIKRPRKSAPGAGEGSGDEEGAPPAKKRRKGMGVPKPHTTTTKKGAKKSKKQQLPPARPSSNEFVDSD